VKRIKAFFQRYTEIILVILTIVFVFYKSSLPKYGERISLMFFGTLAFYYLASGVLVFLDRHRILRTIRLIYLIGLWAVSMAVIGIMARIHLIRMNEELLYISCAALAGTLAFSWLAYRQVDEGEQQQAWRWQLQPIVIRSTAALLFSLGIVLITPYTVYHTFGTYRNDAQYTEDAVYVYEHPEDTAAQKKLEEATLLKSEDGKRNAE